MMAFQFRTTSSIDKSVPYGREQEQAMEKKQLEKELNQLEAEVADLTAKLEEAGKGSAGAAGALLSELSKIRFYAGLTPVTGPGVEVTLDVPSAGPGTTTGRYIIKDDDLLRVVNDLRGAGAEAMDINGQRIIATTEIRLAGNHINVNMVRLEPPYKITAVGNAGTLKSSLEIKNGLAEYLNEFGVTTSIVMKDRVTVPAFTRGLNFEYAKPAQK
ncbi:MAG: DUF881 domain-containing protein [Firmicutes bacterium]|nr:DUF881 domain-containing protein [Bacillota bacterium]